MKMVNKTSVAVTLLGLLFVLGVLIATSEGVRKKGKFNTPGGSHCRWIEKKRHNGTDIRYTLACRCHRKGGGTMRYRCHYHTSFSGTRIRGLQFRNDFLDIMRGKTYIFTIKSLSINCVYVD